MAAKSGSKIKSGSTRRREDTDKDQLISELKNRVAALEYELKLKSDAACGDAIGCEKTSVALRDTLLEASRFRQAMELMPTYVYMKDLQSRYIYANKHTLELFGCSAEELVGSGDSRFFPPETVKQLREIDLRVFAGEQTYEEVDVADIGSGRRVYVEIKTPIYEGLENKVISGLLGISTDITERKRAEEALRRSEVMLAKSQEMAHIGSWEQDVVTGRIERSAESYRIFGVDPDEIKINYQDFLGLIVPEDRERVNRLIKSTINTGEPYTVTYNIRRRDGEIRALQSHGDAECDPSGRIIKLRGTNQDITEFKRAEEAMEEAKARAELYLDLMGHDLNNMHQIALGYLELAKGLPPGVQHDEMIEKPIEVLQRGAQLIRNVRKLQKINEELFLTLEVDVGGVLSAVQREFGAVPEKRVTLNLHCRGHCFVLANELLHDVFANLVSNAIKHTGNRADINIDLDIVKVNSRQYCRVSVEDDGPGIPDDFKGVIFNRVLKGTKKAKGLGLGLYLVKSLVGSYGGRVWVEDRVKGDNTKGARFVVMLPVVENP